MDPDDLAAHISGVWAQARGIVGLSVGATFSDGSRAIETRGFADALTQKPVTTRTRFRVGSLTKVATTLTMLAGVDAESVALETPVETLLPRIRFVGSQRRVQVRHLLSHTAGIGEFRRLRDLLSPAFYRGVSEQPDLGDFYSSGLLTETEPGAHWAYSNHGFAIAGLVVEAVTQLPIAEAITRDVLAPLHMDSTGFEPSPDLATGYNARGRPVPYRPRRLAAAGGLISTTGDLLDLAAAILQATRGPATSLPLKSATIQRALQPEFTVHPAATTSQGLGFVLEQDGTVVGHDGVVPGFRSALRMSPTAGWAVAVAVTGADAMAATRLANDLVERLTPDTPRQAQATSPADGTFTAPQGLATTARAWALCGGQITIANGPAGPSLRAPSPLRSLRRGTALAPLRDGCAVADLDGIIVEVLTDPIDPDRVCLGFPFNLAFERSTGPKTVRVDRLAVEIARRARRELATIRRE